MQYFTNLQQLLLMLKSENLLHLVNPVITTLAVIWGYDKVCPVCVCVFDFLIVDVRCCTCSTTVLLGYWKCIKTIHDYNGWRTQTEKYNVIFFVCLFISAHRSDAVAVCNVSAQTMSHIIYIHNTIMLLSARFMMAYTGKWKLKRNRPFSLFCFTISITRLYNMLPKAASGHTQG